MSSASTIFGTKAYVCARYFLRPGKCFKYIASVARMPQNTSMRSWRYIRTASC